MTRERLLGFTMIALGCLFVALGVLLALQRPDVMLVGIAVAVLGSTFALFSAATYVVRAIHGVAIRT